MGPPRGDKISAEEAEALDRVEEVIRTVLDSEKVILESIEQVADKDLLASEYLATRPLFLEYLTYQGDEVTGAEPPPRT